MPGDGLDCARDDRIVATYEGFANKISDSPEEALAHWFSWNETTFQRDDLVDRSDADQWNHRLEVDGGTVFELRIIGTGWGFRAGGYTLCSEAHEEVFVVSDQDRALFGPDVTMPECEPVGRAGYSTAEPTTDPDESPCRADGDDAVIVPCGPGGPPCDRRRPSPPNTDE